VPKIQLKLMGLLAALVAVVVLAAGAIAERGLRQREQARLERSLGERAELVRELVAGVPLRPEEAPRLAERVRRAGAAAGLRVTLVAPDGRVVADSEVPSSELPRLENHADREEVRTALAGSRGLAARRSGSVGREMIYVALPAADGVGAVRVATDLRELETAVADLRRRLLGAGAIGLAASLVAAFLAARLTLRPLAEMREVLGAIGRGDLRARLRPRSQDELGEIARAINGMAEQLRLRLDQITAEKEQLQAVLASMVEGVLVLDSDGRVALANPRVREVLSIWGPVAGRKLLEVVRHPGIDDALRAAAEASAPVVHEVEVGDRDPRTLLIHAVGFPEHGPRAGTVAVFHDVTELRHLENVRRDFVANASHELQTPLTAIRGFAETLLANPLPPEQVRSQLEVILRNAERLGHLIRDMLELAQVESRRVPLQPTAVDLGKLTRTLLRDVEPRLEQRALEASVRDETDGGAVAWADRRAVEQVLTNLLDNAIKYTSPGGRIAVEITARLDGLRVSVADTGIGIPPESLGRIFERFYRVDKARSRSLGGTGLGLAIVKHLVQAMGGEIYVESEVGRGSIFRFTLPRADRR
jgi:two-component system phosphate regulon sensor histidine kinase PhoR